MLFLGYMKINWNLVKELSILEKSKTNIFL